MNDLNKNELCLLTNNSNTNLSNSNFNSSFNSNIDLIEFDTQDSVIKFSNIYPTRISNYSEFVKFVSDKNENEKKFTNLTKTELQKMIDYNRRMQTDFKYSDLEINIGSAKIILFEQKKIKYIMININKIEKKLLELIRWSSMSFPTDFQIGLIIYK